MTPDFIVHEASDSVGVVVVEGIKAGQELSGWVMGTDETISLRAEAAVPLGHKVAVKLLEEGATVLKYAHDIGRAVEAIAVGGYVHAHNIKTKRW